MYESYLIEPHEISEILEEVNENKWEIVSVVHLGESQQLLLIVNIEEKKPTLRLFEKTGKSDAA